MRRYLKQFLSDPRVIEKRGLKWWLILNGLILTRRPRKSGRAYRKIWNTERDESPLLTVTRATSDKLGAQLSDQHDIIVDWAMRYGQPSIADALDRLCAQGCDRVLLAPLYPQYAAPTTATALDDAYRALATLRHQPAIRTLPPYHDQPAYIEALRDSIQAHIRTAGWQPDAVIASFHGLPQAFIENGDPYQRQCEDTVARLRSALGPIGERLTLSYQSRPGRGVWIGPHLEEELVRMAGQGVGKVMVVAPGFAADCLETLEEIDIRARQTFLAAGGLRFAHIPCLNDTPAAIALLASLTGRQLQGLI
jgi:protoporphyrin/coproporphyrin ferrochelatase